MFGPKVIITRKCDSCEVEYIPSSLIPEHRRVCFTTSNSLKDQRVHIKTIEYHRDIISTATIHNQVHILQYLIENGMDVECLKSADIICGVIKRGSVETLKYLLTVGLTIDDLKKRSWPILESINKNNRDDFRQYFSEIGLDLTFIKRPKWSNRFETNRD